MPNSKSLSNVCVKIVNKLRRLGSLISDNTYTTNHTPQHIYTKFSVQTIFNKPTTPHYSTYLYTYLNSKFNLLNKSFTHYPQSLLMRLIKEI